MKRKFRFPGGRYTVWKDVISEIVGTRNLGDSFLFPNNDFAEVSAGFMWQEPYHTGNYTCIEPKTGQLTTPTHFICNKEVALCSMVSVPPWWKLGLLLAVPGALKPAWPMVVAQQELKGRNMCHLQPLGFSSHMKPCVQGAVFLLPQGRQGCFQPRAFLELRGM